MDGTTVITGLGITDGTVGTIPGGTVIIRDGAIRTGIIHTGIIHTGIIRIGAAVISRDGPLHPLTGRYDPIQAYGPEQVYGPERPSGPAQM